MSLVVDKVSLAFDKPIFTDVSFALEKGDIACLLGRSGCGKTSLLRCILGFNTPLSGSISLDGTPLFAKGVNVLPHQRHIGMVFQDYGLFPHLTVAQNIAFGLKDDNQAGKRVSDLLDLVQLAAFARRYPHELSGGQQQRVALARAIAPVPSFILLDEPFSNLDVTLKQGLSDEITALLKSQGIGAILVTHDQSEAFAMADKVGVMSEGHLCQWDTPMGLYHRPADAFVASFIGDGGLLPIVATGEQSHVQTAVGPVPCPNASAGKSQVLIRPHDVRLSADSSAGQAATVLDRRFQDGQWLYRVGLSDPANASIRLKAYSQHNWQPGERIFVQVNSGWAV